MQGQQIYVPPLTKVNKYILIAIGGSFLIQSLLQTAGGVSLINYMGLSTDGFLSGYVHSIFTYPLVQTGLMGVIFDGLIIWFIGSELESKWGTKDYSIFLASSVLVAGFIYLVFSKLFFSSFLPLVGVNGISYALLLAFAILFPDRILTFMLIFPMKAKYFCMILMGILLFNGFISQAQTAWGHLGAMLGGFAYMYWITKSRATGRSGKVLNLFKKKNRNNLYIVKDDNAPNKPNPNDPKYWN